MTYTRHYATVEPTRAEVDARPGYTLLEFGAPWCGYCISAQPLVERALQAHPDVAHLKIEDGSGRPLGRSFRIKLWPSLVLLREGEELGRVVRPAGQEDVDRLLVAAAAPPSR
jgi:thioredoxin 1